MKKIIKYLGHKVECFFLWSSGADTAILHQVPMEKINSLELVVLLFSLL
jgi:hypothetical protein